MKSRLNFIYFPVFYSNFPLHRDNPHGRDDVVGGLSRSVHMQNIQTVQLLLYGFQNAAPRLGRTQLPREFCRGGE